MTGKVMEAERLRRAFTEFFVERGHAALSGASLVPNDPSILFTIAGMIPFKEDFLSETVPAVPRVTTIQPCLRTNDIEVVGHTARHCTFFEMLGNFSFGDYFKEQAIPWAYEFVTDVLGFETDLLWVTVHDSDDEAAEIWPSTTGIPAERVQRLGEDNFWRMGPTGPCGPSSEIFFDRGPDAGEGGGPAVNSGDRYPEVWNLVFTQFDQVADGELVPLPKRNIDTGAGLDRLLVILQGVDNVQEIDSVSPILEAAARLTGQSRHPNSAAYTGLRVIADHARAFTFAAADGVFPSNEGRGYVLRRLVRRAVLRAYQLGRTELITPDLVEAVVGTMGADYPKLRRDAAQIQTVIGHEEEAFLRTLRQGTSLLEQELRRAGTVIPGDAAFLLHDTYGFPFELTKEVAAERGMSVDEAGFEAQMNEQRERARRATRAHLTDEESALAWRRLRDEVGPNEFTGYSELSTQATVTAVLGSAVDPASFENVDGERAPEGHELLEVFLDRTPFYAEGGGQVGDTGSITTATGRLRVLDTTSVADGLARHLGYVVDGTITAGEGATAQVDAERRAAIRRNHTGTHLLHWALRRVLGDHVRQQGSLVAADRLRFDFSHFSPLSEEEVSAIEDLVNERVLDDQPVETLITSRDEAELSGAIAFFGEKYGHQVRVVHAGHDSVELCGGTHVAALGMIGPLRIVSESSIGANTRRVEATTGTATLERSRLADRTLGEAAELLRAQPSELTGAVHRVLQRQRSLEDELKQARTGQLQHEAAELAAAAVADNGSSGPAGVVVARRDGLDPNALRELALAVRDRPGVRGVALAGVPEAERVALVVAVTKESGLDARAAASEAAKAVGGGGGGSAELATAGGKDPSGIGEALERLRRALGGDGA